MKAKQRLFRTVDGDIVPEGDERARFLVAAGEGDDVPDEYAKAVRAFETGETDAEESEAAPADDKAAAKPADKAVKKAANK